MQSDQEKPETFLEHLKASLPKNWQQILAWIVVAVISSIATHFGKQAIDPGPIPIPLWEARIESLERRIGPEELPLEHKGNQGVQWNKIKADKVKTEPCCPQCKCREK